MAFQSAVRRIFKAIQAQHGISDANPQQSNIPVEGQGAIMSDIAEIEDGVVGLDNRVKARREPRDRVLLLNLKLASKTPRNEIRSVALCRVWLTLRTA